jgi:hypothetical protein
MHQSDIDDINRKLAILAAKYGFAATARKAPRDEGKVVFDAFAWHKEEVLNHTATYSESELSPVGPVAIATRFIEEARSKLPSGHAR